MASRSTKDLQPVLTNAYTDTAARYAKRHPDYPQPFITCTYRSPAEQAELFAQGRDKPGKIVTYAKPGQSPHNYVISWAFDIAFINKFRKLDWSIKYFQIFADILAEKHNLVLWGGDFKNFKDRPHFELKNWQRLRIAENEKIKKDVATDRKPPVKPVAKNSTVRTYLKAEGNVPG